MTILVRVEAPHFVAGLLIDGDVCFAAAPILGWAIGKGRDEMRSYFSKMGWKATIVRDKAPEPVVEG